MKITVRSILFYCLIFWVFLFIFVVRGCHPAYAATQPINCVSSEDGYGTNTTQCTDGTVTVTRGSDVTVCSKNDRGEMVCQRP